MIVVDLALHVPQRLAHVVAVPQAGAQQDDVVHLVVLFEVFQRPDGHARAGRQSDQIDLAAGVFIAVLLDHVRQPRATQLGVHP